MESDKERFSRRRGKKKELEGNEYKSRMGKSIGGGGNGSGQHRK